MSDLINRQDAIMHFVKASENYECGIFSLAEVTHELWEIPSAQRRGEWKREVLGSTSGYGTTVMYQCSECERMSISKYSFCPNCGADMRGNEEDSR